MATAKKTTDTVVSPIAVDLAEVVKPVKKAVPKAAKVSVTGADEPKVAKAVKAPAVKKAPAKKAANSVTPEQRYEMIATAAYYLAERRGFTGGYDMHDWIAAEAEIDTQLSV